MTHLVNLTPHDIVISPAGRVPMTILKSGDIARVSETVINAGHTNGIPTENVTYGTVTGLPDPRDGVVYVVSQLLAYSRPDRHDLVFPGELTRDEDGRVNGATNFRRLDPDVVSTDLSPREQVLAQWLPVFTQQHGQLWKIEAHYLEDNPFDDRNCGKCIFFQDGTCVIVEGEIRAEAVCRFYVVPGLTESESQSLNTNQSNADVEVINMTDNAEDAAAAPGAPPAGGEAAAAAPDSNARLTALEQSMTSMEQNIATIAASLSQPPATPAAATAAAPAPPVAPAPAPAAPAAPATAGLAAPPVAPVAPAAAPVAPGAQMTAAEFAMNQRVAQLEGQILQLGAANGQPGSAPAPQGEAQFSRDDYGKFQLLRIAIEKGDVVKGPDGTYIAKEARHA